MTPAEVLRKAADLMEQVGWWNGRGDPGGRRCAVTAIEAVSREVGADWWPVYRAAYDATLRELGLSTHDVLSSWNDDQVNGEVVVPKFLREVADDLERAS